MINLIPPIGHKAVRKEYYFRVAATLSLLFSSALIVVGLSFVPMFVLVKTQVRAFDSEMGSGGESGISITAANDEVKRVNGIITQLKTTEKQHEASEYVRLLQEVATEEIEIRNIQFDLGKEGTAKVVVQGVADTRAALVTYKTKLEGLPAFSKAEIPISDLVKDSELPFGITLTISKK